MLGSQISRVRAFLLALWWRFYIKKKQKGYNKYTFFPKDCEEVVLNAWKRESFEVTKIICEHFKSTLQLEGDRYITRGEVGFSWELEFWNKYIKHFHPCNIKYSIPYCDEFLYFYLNNIKMKTMLNLGPTIQTVDMIHGRIYTIQQSVNGWNRWNM